MEKEIFEQKDCIGCGYCCTKAQCIISIHLYGKSQKCPSLKWNGERHICNLMIDDTLLSRQYRKELGIGLGCCSSLNSWRNEPLKDRTEGVFGEDGSLMISPLMGCFLKVLVEELEMTSETKCKLSLRFNDALKKEGFSRHEIAEIEFELLRILWN